MLAFFIVLQVSLICIYSAAIQGYQSFCFSVRLQIRFTPDADCFS